MLARQRQERILEALRASGGVRVADLTEQLQVSYMTSRRDLDALSDQGLVEKVQPPIMSPLCRHVASMSTWSQLP